MADPTNPTDPSLITPTADQAAALQNYTQAVQDYTSAEGGLETVLNNVSNAWKNLDRKMQDVNLTLDTLGSMNDQQITQLGLISTGVFKAREAFTGLAGIDFGNLSTFKDTLGDIREALFSGGTAASDAASMIGRLGSALLASGTPQKVLNDAWQKGSSAVLDLASGILTHTDNLMRSQSAYIQMAAATGNLGDLWNAAGTDLQNLNTIMETQTQMLGDTIAATGLSAKQVESYYAELGQVPGALNAIINTTGKTGETTSMLTAAIQVATGTGRKYADVMDDLKVAFKDYGLVGEDALKFSVRMSEVSTKLKAPLDDVKRALQGSADAFRMFASSQGAATETSEGLAKILNTYGKALESTGLSATQSISVVGQLTNQMANLSIAQKAYISQQTGGAGGLQGGFQIENRLMKGDTEGVFNDFLQTLQRQFGKIVSIDEASQSQGAASQLEKQTLMLMQGPLGALVKDQQTAIKVLQAFRNKQEGKADTITTALSPTAVSDAADKGMKFQEGSYSELTKIRGDIERMRYLADQGIGRGVQEALTARASPNATENEGLLKSSLSEVMRTARTAGGTQVATTAYQMSTGNVSDRTGMDAARTVQNAMNSLKDIPLSFKTVFDKIKGAMTSGNTDVIEAQRAELEQRKNSANDLAAATKEGTDQHRKALAESAAAQKLLNTIAPIKLPVEAPRGIATPTTSAGASAFPLPPSAHIRAAAHDSAAISQPAGKQVGDAARTSVARVAAGVTSAQPGTSAAQGPGTTGQEMTVNLVGKFTMDCPHCGRPHNVSSQALITPQQFSVPH